MDLQCSHLPHLSPSRYVSQRTWNTQEPAWTNAACRAAYFWSSVCSWMAAAHDSSMMQASCSSSTCFRGQRADGRCLAAAGAEMSQTELVAMLRSRARKSGTQTSHFRGVSLLKQTGKWHAQINVGGKQVSAALHTLQAAPSGPCCTAYTDPALSSAVGDPQGQAVHWDDAQPTS